MCNIINTLFAHCALEGKAPEERYGTKMYKKIQDSERDQGNKF